MIAELAAGRDRRSRPGLGLGLAAGLGLLSPQAHARDEADLVYEFVAPRELDDFQVEDGSWRVYGGALLCSTKGAADSLLWRRSLAGATAIELDVASAGACSLELSSEDHTLGLRLHRARGTLLVEEDGRELRRFFFEHPPSRPLRLSVSLGTGLAVSVGDDVTIDLDATSDDLLRLRLKSHEGQASFPRLLVRRDRTRVREESEQRRLMLEDALAELTDGKPPASLALLLDLVPQTDGGEARESWPFDLLTAFQKVGLADPGLWDQRPFDQLRREGAVQSRDGAASLCMPLQPGWSVELHPCRRIDGILFQLRHGDGVEATLRRYDQRIDYWFGAEPRLRFVGGSDPRSLAEARLADLRIEFEGAVVRREVKESPRPLGGETAHTFDLGYQRAPGSTLDGPRRRQEFFARFRGNTYRWSIDGPPEALERHAEALAWTSLSLRWHRSAPPDDGP